MKFSRKKFFLLLIAITLAGVGGCLYNKYQEFLGPGRTIEETASILVHDSKFGMRAKQKAIQYGNTILPLIMKESDNFKILDGRNSFWIADVLGAIRTDQSRAILTDLYSRTKLIDRLTGAIGLAQQGILPDDVDEDSFLVKTVRADPSQTETQLAIIALGWSKNKKALPCLLDLLKRHQIDYWHHAYASEALARIGAPEAIPVLRDSLKSNEYYALPEAFRSLIALGDREAVPLAIARVTPEIKDKNSGFVVNELQKVTGQSYGYDKVGWEKWWKSVEPEWQIPKKFTRPWEQQERMY